VLNEGKKYVTPKKEKREKIEKIIFKSMIKKINN
jgi:hypothetical protein